MEIVVEINNLCAKMTLFIYVLGLQLSNLLSPDHDFIEA